VLDAVILGDAQLVEQLDDVLVSGPGLVQQGLSPSPGAGGVRVGLLGLL
jgi:hypothetical protein